MKWLSPEVFEIVVSLVLDSVALVNGEVRRTLAGVRRPGARIAQAAWHGRRGRS